MTKLLQGGTSSCYSVAREGSSMPPAQTVTVAFGSTEVKRYELHCEAGPGEHQEEVDARLIIAAKALLQSEGFTSADVEMASFRPERAA